MLTWVNSTPTETLSQPAILNVLAAFVAVNTLMYMSLAIVKMLPRIHLPKALRRDYQRAETRSIFPNTAP
jgi:hypothetical protein